MPAFIELFSDTKTQPTPPMRRAMAQAQVGDEAAGEDPTVNQLCERVATLLGREAAVFMPSGTMCNQVSLTVLARPGDEVVCDVGAHIVCYEAGGLAANAGLNALTLPGERGRFSAQQLRAALRMPMRHAPRQSIVSVEQTCNLGGGAIWPLAQLREVVAVARAHGMATHMDGARLLNAVVATGVSAAEQSEGFDAVWIDFSKGLGAPVGAALAGSSAFIDEAWRVKHRFGGAMRQAGIVAAAALYALEHHVERLAEDHANARRLAEGLAQIDGIGIDPATVETNLVYFDLDERVRMDAPTFCTQLLAEHGVRMGAMGPRRVRAVTHLDVDRAGIDTALAAIAALM
ncbi:MAG TPA: GntG family PLP-dependent aldolase [Xanthomonadaceae bacterium]|nr:GntG family PLP-dependent aldolase [Xanthomonadaceae bacterium]